MTTVKQQPLLSANRAFMLLTLFWLVIVVAITLPDQASAAETFNLTDPETKVSQPDTTVSGQPAGTGHRDAIVSSPKAPQSRWFGAQLFTGAFTGNSPSTFNPGYTIKTGDQIQVRLWGAFQFDAVQTVDAQGNIFVPHIGPVKVTGLPNSELQAAFDRSVKRVFTSNVESYVSLASAQPVRIFVTGYVAQPGMYNGTSMDSVLQFLDQAGGIDPERGSYLNVQVKRHGQVRKTIDLYKFLLHGFMPPLQLADGDVILVNPKQSFVKVTGLADDPRLYEFSGASVSLKTIVRMTQPAPSATHIRIIRNTGPLRNTEYYRLDDVGRVQVQDGDEVMFSADKRVGTITVRVEGEHQSPQEYVLRDGARLGQLMQRIQMSPHSNAQGLQLYRSSIKARQKEKLSIALRSLEASVLSARSATKGEAGLRQQEANLLLKWVERAMSIEPTGRVYLGKDSDTRAMLLLEDGDVIRIAKKDNLVLVSGEVLFPNAVVWDRRLSLKAYIHQAGGYTQNANTSRVIIARQTGLIEQAGWFEKIQPGDEIMVLPKVNTKSMQITQDLTQILYQIAVSAGVVLAI
jgi:protein involved in polysaccharide export with SLBB domain